MRAAPGMVLLLGLAGCASHKPVAQQTSAEFMNAPQVDGAQHSTEPQLYSSQELDSVDPQPAPRFTEDTQLPSIVAYDAEDMDAYMSAPKPQSSAPLRLEDIYGMALNNDPVLKSAYSELQAVGYGVTAARAGLLPSISLEGTFSDVSQEVLQSENQVYRMGAASWTEQGYNLTLNQPLFDLGIYHKWRQAQDSERKEVANYAFAQQDLMLRTATAYLGVQAAQDQIALTTAEKKTTAKQMELVQARYDSGQETEVGVREVQARLDIQEANVLLAKNSYFDRQEALHEIIGYGDLNLMPVRMDFALKLPEPNNPKTWLQKALEQNWSIRAAAASVDVAKKEVSIQRAGYYPTLNLKASTGNNETGGSLFGGGSEVSDTRTMLSLSIPIFQGGYTYGMSHAASSRLSSATMQLSLARRKVQRQVYSSFQNIAIGIDRIGALKSSVGSFELALTLKEEGFKAGLNDIVSVLDASRNLYNAKRQEAEARYNYLLDTLKLKQAAGLLSDEDIVAISRIIL